MQDCFPEGTLSSRADRRGKIMFSRGNNPPYSPQKRALFILLYRIEQFIDILLKYRGKPLSRLLHVYKLVVCVTVAFVRIVSLLNVRDFP